MTLKIEPLSPLVCRRHTSILIYFCAFLIISYFKTLLRNRTMTQYSTVSLNDPFYVVITYSIQYYGVQWQSNTIYMQQRTSLIYFLQSTSIKKQSIHRGHYPCILISVHSIFQFVSLHFVFHTYNKLDVSQEQRLCSLFSSTISGIGYFLLSSQGMTDIT